MFKTYLKGLHMTIDSWRLLRDKEGWKLTGKELKEARAKLRQEWRWREEDLENFIPPVGEVAAPVCVKAVARFAEDVLAMLQLCEAEVPPSRTYRSSRKMEAI